MDNETLFYVCGVVLAVSAVIITFVGLRLENFPGRIGPLIGMWVVLFVLGVTTFAVLHAQDEHEHEAAELHQAGEEVEERESGSVEGSQGADEGGQGAAAENGGQAKAAGTTLKIAADPAEIAFDTTSLSSKPGEVTIDFSNPATIEHNVAVEKGGKVLAESDTITKGETSVTVDLEAGSYTYVCTVPGHEEAGMKGVLAVK